MKRLVIIRGGGEIASSAAIYLHQAGFRVLILETSQPTSIRREVSFADAAYDGQKTVERVTCTLADSPKAAEKRLKDGELVMLIDPTGKCIADFKPKVLLDGILAHANTGTNREMAEHTLALGPGFCAGRDVDAVIETMRGHEMGRIVYEGYSKRDEKSYDQEARDALERIILAPETGEIESLHHISFQVKEGEPIAKIHLPDKKVIEVVSPIKGVLRGIMRDGLIVTKGKKIADVNHVMRQSQCFKLSDKARCIGGAVLEAVMIWESKKRRFWQ